MLIACIDRWDFVETLGVFFPFMLISGKTKLSLRLVVGFNDTPCSRVFPTGGMKIWKTLYSGVVVTVLALLTSWKVSVQQLKMCFCLQMLVDFNLINLMMVEMDFMNFQKVNWWQLHFGSREICHTFGNLFLLVPLSLTPIVVLKNFVEMVLQQWIGSFH